MEEIPHHIAIIMDGNRRWAREHGLPVLAGHKRVTDDILEPLIEHASDLGIGYLTFWAWSTENWKRDRTEVSGIMRLFRHVIRDRWDRLHKKGVRIRIIGDVSQFSKDLQRSLAETVTKTADNTRITVVFALNYGGRDEILRAVSRVNSAQHPSPRAHVTREMFAQCLDTAGIPDPEIIVRTGGEQRLSGFLLWQSEYSELFFPEWFMPDFTPDKLDSILEEYRSRNRRFGR
jgi:undecaprenyl diphosphate synthase